MAHVKCPDCGLEYDDVYHWTFCPHDLFEMRTIVLKDGKEYVATSLEELDAIMRGPARRVQRWLISTI